MPRIIAPLRENSAVTCWLTEWRLEITQISRGDDSQKLDAHVDSGEGKSLENTRGLYLMNCNPLECNDLTHISTRWVDIMYILASRPLYLDHLYSSSLGWMKAAANPDQGSYTWHGPFRQHWASLSWWFRLGLPMHCAHGGLKKRPDQFQAKFQRTPNSETPCPIPFS